MTFALNLANTGAEVEWSSTLMITWLVIVLALSIIEVWLTGGFSSRTVSKARADQ
jgi:hypothetical protein